MQNLFVWYFDLRLSLLIFPEHSRNSEERVRGRQCTSVAYDRHKHTEEQNKARTRLSPRRLHLLSVGTILRCRYIFYRR